MIDLHVKHQVYRTCFLQCASFNCASFDTFSNFLTLSFNACLALLQTQNGFIISMNIGAIWIASSLTSRQEIIESDQPIKLDIINATKMSQLTVLSEGHIDSRVCPSTIMIHFKPRSKRVIIFGTVKPAHVMKYIINATVLTQGKPLFKCFRAHVHASTRCLRPPCSNGYVMGGPGPLADSSWHSGWQIGPGTQAGR